MGLDTTRLCSLEEPATYIQEWWNRQSSLHKWISLTIALSSSSSSSSSHCPLLLKQSLFFHLRFEQIITITTCGLHRKKQQLSNRRTFLREKQFHQCYVIQMYVTLSYCICKSHIISGGAQSCFKRLYVCMRTKMTLMCLSYFGYVYCQHIYFTNETYNLHNIFSSWCSVTYSKHVPGSGRGTGAKQTTVHCTAT